MTRMIEITLAAAALAMAHASPAAAAAGPLQLYAGVLESIVDTTGDGCGQKVGQHLFFVFRPKAGDLPASVSIRFQGIEGFLQSSEADGTFHIDRGKMGGTLNFVTKGRAPWVHQAPIRGASYKLRVDPADPSMIKILRMDMTFMLRELGLTCTFIWNGVMTPMLMPSAAPAGK